MRLALCLEYSISQFGGTEVLVRELIHGLAGRHELVLVSDDATSTIENSPWHSIVARHISYPRVTKDATRAAQLADALQAEGVQLAHFHLGGNYGWESRSFTRSPIVQVAHRGIPCITTNHGAFSIGDGICGSQRHLAVKLALFPFGWLSKQYVLAQVKCEVMVSRHDYNAVRRWYPAMRHQFRQIYHSKLHVAPGEKSGAPVEERTTTILCLGSVGPRKGQPYLVAAFGRIAKRHPAWRLVLIGRPSEAVMMREIENLVAEHELSDRVLIQPGCSDEEARDWMRTSAIYSMPSVAEGLGLSLQEALFYGCACVASRAGGMQDLIQDGDNGLLVEPRNVEALAAALDLLIRDEGLRRRFQERGPASVLEKGMTAEQMVAAYERLYEKCLSS